MLFNFHSRWVVVALVAAVLMLTLVRRLLRRLLVLLVLRYASREKLNEVGRRAVARLPGTIKLIPSRIDWKRSVVQDYIEPAIAAGYTDAGTFAVDTMPGVYIRLISHTRDNVQAAVYDHPRGGNWIEMMTRYADGTVHSLTTMKKTGLNRPEWITKIYADLAPVAMLHNQLLQARKHAEMLPAKPEAAARDYEEGYARLMAWTQLHTPRAEEVVEVGKRGVQRNG